MEILIPHGLPHQSQTFELMLQTSLPAMTTFASHAKVVNPTVKLDFPARAHSHSAWLAQQFGLTSSIESENSPPIACTLLHSFGLMPNDGFWFVLTPVHLEVGMSQITLTDPTALPLDETETSALFEAAKTIFDDKGMELLYGDAKTWFVRADHWKTLRTAMPDTAIGRDIRNWQPEGEAELAWRQLQNEVQMQWHAHPVNQQRDARGESSINSLWLWGGAPCPPPTAHASSTFTNTYRFSGWMRAFNQFSSKSLASCTIEDIITAPPKRGLLLLDDLSAPALSLDWTAWAQTWQTIDAAWLAPMISALSNRQIAQLTLHISHDTHLISFVLNQTSLRKFWIRKNLDALRP